MFTGQVLLEMDARAFGKPEVQLTRRNPIKNDQNGTLINQLAKGTVRANLEAFAAFMRKSQPGAH